MLRLSERVRTTSEQIAGMWNSDKMRSRCDSRANSIAAASRSAKTLMQQQQHSATETAGQGGVILFWPRIFPSPTDFQPHDAIFSAVAEIRTLSPFAPPMPRSGYFGAYFLRTCAHFRCEPVVSVRSDRGFYG